MYAQLTRAQLRDQIRRELGQTPPVDDGSGGAAGSAPTRWPKPTNTDLNVSIDDAVAFISRKCKIAGDAVARTIPVPAQTADGPYYVYLQTLAPFGSVKEIRRVAWAATGDDPVPLSPTSRQQLERERYSIEAATVGTPRRYWIDGGALLIDPAPDSDGALYVHAGTALWSEAATIDAEIPELIDTDHFPILVAQACVNTCRKFPGDAEMQKRLPIFMATVKDGMGDMIYFYACRAAEEQGGFQADSGRVPGYGYR